MHEKSNEKTVVALFDRLEDAKAAIIDLAQAGIARSQVGVLANAAAGHPGILSNPAYAREDMEKPESDATSGMGLWAEIGAGLGGLIGFLVGIGTITIPGIGPLIAAGAWVAVAGGAALGGVVGGAIGYMRDRGISDEDAHLYAEGLRRGGTLVTAHVPNDRVEAITKLFQSRNAVDIEKREAAWRAEGWISFNPDAEPLTPSQLTSMRIQHVESGHQAAHHHDIRHYNTKADGAAPQPDGVTNQGTRYAEDQMRT